MVKFFATLGSTQHHLDELGEMMDDLDHERYMRRAIELAAKVFADRIHCDEGREGVASFIEKRKPTWAVKP